MRFAKVFFALLFGAVFLITLMKVLFFALFAALVFGGISLARRAFWSRRMAQFQGSEQQFYVFGQGQNSPFAQPLNPNWQKRTTEKPVFGRRIEVI